MGYSSVVTTESVISFPLAFPNRCLWVSECDHTGANGTMKTIWQFRSITATGLNALNMGTLTKGSSTFNTTTASGCVYFAIGY
ncbi:gp53-like domain-containing protein [Pseudomonas marginalis]